MSSGDDWTHQWILTNMGPSCNATNDDSRVIQNSSEPFIPNFSLEDPTVLESQAPDEGVSNSPVTSLDLDRESPMACGLDDDDIGPPSIETQPPDNTDDLEVARIMSSWISSGVHYGSLHPAVGFPTQSKAAVMRDSDDFSEVTPSAPGLDGGDYCTDILPVYGPTLPTGPHNSPIRETNFLPCGDIKDNEAASGLCGLRNLGNTCFMAAGIQCLVNTPPIAQYFFNHHLDSEDAQLTLAGRFSQLTHKIWSGKYSSLRPSEFKEAFGQHWRDFRDYRQHDCQEFMTLLLEALRKQMPISEDESGTSLYFSEANVVSAADRNTSCTSSSICSRESRGSTSPTPSLSPSPLSPISLKQSFETRNDSQEDTVTLDSGTASPKSSVSSSSVDAHLISLRLQPIPEEVKHLNRAAVINTSIDDLSVTGTISCQDTESIASDISDPGEGGHAVSGVASVRRYNHLSTSGDICDTSSETEANSTLTSHYHCLQDTFCDSSLNPIERSSMGPLLSRWENVPLEKNEKASMAMAEASSSGHLAMVKLEDILKESKTSNVNVLVKDNIPNNEFVFDSEKYARIEGKKLKNSLNNLSQEGFKRIKEVNLLVDKMDNSQLQSCSFMNSKSSSKGCSSSCQNSLKRIRLEEKNVQYEIEKTQNDLCECIGDVGALGPPSKSSSHPRRVRAPTTSAWTEEQRISGESWKMFVGDGKSAVVDTFYGQFKSSLVCCVCGHTSIKFDPFGTLSVPLPHANEVQIPVTYLHHEGSVTRCLVTLFKVSTILDLKIALAKIFGTSDHEVVITEVFDNHIARTVEERHQIKFLNHNLRNIYAFELLQAPSSTHDIEGTALSKEGVSTETVLEDGKTASASEPEDGQETAGEVCARWQPCNICLEELCQTDLKTHIGCEDCVLCEGCIEMSCKHHGGESLPCPVCHTQLSPLDLIPVAKQRTEAPKARILRVPVVYRVDTESGDNNKRGMKLIGHPSMLSLQSRMKSSTLSAIIKEKILPDAVFSLLFVDGRGYNCSRCLFSSHCHGCEVMKNMSEVTLQAGDTLCVRFTAISMEQKQLLSKVTEHESLMCLRQNAPLTLYDCLRAFTQSETLENSDSWYCPKCDRKQQTTKTIAVWKYPPYLIIHLERFLFHGAISVKLDDKVIFPLDGLDLSDFTTGDRSSPLLYNLYSCVCHMGVAQAGHYTALVRSPVTGEWHYFNDDNVTRQRPGEEEYSTSYLLFYHRQGTSFDLSLPQNFDATFKDYSRRRDDGEEVVGSSSDANLGACHKRVCVEGVLDHEGRKPVAAPSSSDDKCRKSSSARGRKRSNREDFALPSSSLPSGSLAEIQLPEPDSQGVDEDRCDEVVGSPSGETSFMEVECDARGDPPPPDDCVGSSNCDNPCSSMEG